MAGCTKQTLSQKREEAKIKEAQIQRDFLKSREKMRIRRDDRKNKRKGPYQLLEFLAIDDILVRSIRPPFSYTPKSYNLE